MFWYITLPPPQFSFVKKWAIWGNSLAVQWLRLCTPSSGGPGLIPGQGTRPHLLQLKIPHAATKTCCSQIKNRRKRGLCNASAFPRGLLIYFAFPRILWTWNYTLCTISFIYIWFIDIYCWLTEHPGCWEGHMKNDILTYYGSICGSTTCEQDGSHSEFSKVQVF